ncbi:hypothetical protein D3C85_897390 [compost metagenome]
MFLVGKVQYAKLTFAVFVHFQYINGQAENLFEVGADIAMQIRVFGIAANGFREGCYQWFELGLRGFLRQFRPITPAGVVMLQFILEAGEQRYVAFSVLFVAVSCL